MLSSEFSAFYLIESLEIRILLEKGKGVATNGDLLMTIMMSLSTGSKGHITL